MLDTIKIANTTKHNETHCYWLCNRKAELKVYTDFGNVLHHCRKCYEIYFHEHRLKTGEIQKIADCYYQSILFLFIP